MNVKLADKALKVIEALAEGNCSGPTNHKDDCPFCQIYTIAHAGRSPSCRNSHLSWEEDIERLHKEFSGVNLI
jgi:hypothetical protein